MKTAPHRPPVASGVVMKARFTGSWGIASRANLALALTVLATGSALAAQATPEQKKACTPTSIAFVQARSRMCGPLPPACGGRRPASAKPAGRCSSSEELKHHDARNCSRIRRRIARSNLRRSQECLALRAGAKNPLKLLYYLVFI